MAIVPYPPGCTMERMPSSPYVIPPIARRQAAQADNQGNHDHHPEGAGPVRLSPLPACTSVMPAPGKKLADPIEAAQKGAYHRTKQPFQPRG
jgi:hypothetical protein